MSEEKKEACSTESGCCGCSGIKKLIIMLVLGLLVFTCGYIFGKGGGCPLAPGSKMCPISHQQ